MIGRMKQEHRRGLNHLGGIEGDKFNPILSASAFNLQKLLRSFAVLFFYWLKEREKLLIFIVNRQKFICKKSKPDSKKLAKSLYLGKDKI